MSRAAPADHRAWLRLGAVLAFAAGARSLYLVAERSDPLWPYLLHDAKQYHTWAQALAAGVPWEPGAFYQAPLYPYLLGATYRALGASPLAACVGQALLGIASIALVHRIARRAYGEAPAVAAAVLAALYGPFAFYETKLLPGALSVFLGALVLDRLQAAHARGRPLAWLLAGSALGAAALVRPNLLLLALLEVVALLVPWRKERTAPRSWRRSGVHVAALLAGILAFLAPVAWRNHRASGEIVPVSTNAGITFYQGNNPAAQGVFSTPEGFSGSIFTQREESRALAQAAAGRQLEDAQVSAYWLRRGIAFLTEDTLRALELAGRKLVLALDDYEHALEYNPQLDRNPFRRLMPLPFAVVLGLAAARPFARRVHRSPERPVLRLLAVELATLLLFYVAGRYRLAAMPALITLAGCGAVTLFERVRQGLRSAWPPLLVAAALVAVSTAPLPGRSADLYRREEAMGLCDRGEALLGRGLLAGAEAAFRGAETLDPGNPYAPLDLGKVLARTGRTSEAAASLRRALAIAPALAEAHLDLGVLLYEGGRLEEAAAAFARAFELAPRDGAAGNNLVGTLLRAGRTLEAARVAEVMNSRGLPVDPALRSRIGHAR